MNFLRCVGLVVVWSAVLGADSLFGWNNAFSDLIVSFVVKIMSLTLTQVIGFVVLLVLQVKGG